MTLTLLKCKLHRAEITDTSLHYEGSLAIDADLMAKANLLPFEKILVGNMANGHRFETYAIPGPPGSGMISLNGATAHLGKKGDLVTIMCFAQIPADQANRHRPKILVLADQNRTILKESDK
ncbi:MAG: aspartate 1-decarboxylase [Puniceicoccaceae bacterium]|nr:MAG: aspartate 1-decarboxylase [Puniceicoccaceae bacterium]